MSGTSADAIDVALVQIESKTIHLIDFIDYPNPQKTALHKLNQQPQTSLKALTKLHAELSHTFADAAQSLIKKHRLTPNEILAIGSHGQTIYHAPEYGISLQIGHPAIIAKRTGIKTAGDFRIDNMAVGGQGAPLAPAFHHFLIQPQQPTLVINIGGIANISLLKQNQPPIGFDTGPGNGLMDELCQKHFNQPYDQNGQQAAQVKPNAAWLNQLLEDPFFKQAAPKSTGREYFNQAWLTREPTTLSPLEQLSTLNQLTVETLAQAIEDIPVLPSPTPCYICGGGAYNTTLIQRLQARLPQLAIQTTEAIGIDPNAIEAMMMAWLAYNRINYLPTPLKAITGAYKDTLLGGLWHPD